MLHVRRPTSFNNFVKKRKNKTKVENYSVAVWRTKIITKYSKDQGLFKCLVCITSGHNRYFKLNLSGRGYDGRADAMFWRVAGDATFVQNRNGQLIG